MNHRLILFDYDGVIADSFPVYYSLVREALTRLGHHIITDPEDFRALFDDNFYRSLAQKGVDLATFSRSVYAERRVETPIYPFMPPILKGLATSATLAVISSNAGNTIRAALEAADLLPLFAAIMGSDTAFSKEEKIRRARERFSPPSGEVYYVGDTVGDITEGRAAGATTVAVCWGWHGRERLAHAHPDYLVTDPAALLALFPPT